MAAADFRTQDYLEDEIDDLCIPVSGHVTGAPTPSRVAGLDLPGVMSNARRVITTATLVPASRRPPNAP